MNEGRAILKGSANSLTDAVPLPKRRITARRVGPSGRSSVVRSMLFGRLAVALEFPMHLEMSRIRVSPSRCNT